MARYIQIRVNGVASHTAVFPDDSDPARRLLWHMLTGTAQPEAQSAPVGERDDEREAGAADPEIGTELHEKA